MNLCVILPPTFCSGLLLLFINWSTPPYFKYYPGLVMFSISEWPNLSFQMVLYRYPQLKLYAIKLTCSQHHHYSISLCDRNFPLHSGHSNMPHLSNHPGHHNPYVRIFWMPIRFMHSKSRTQYLHPLLLIVFRAFICFTLFNGGYPIHIAVCYRLY